ncbi:uncharacterized protein LOC113213560 [Frankliniella occidentalis]|uniref:Uncharacterized protein LOC113213560 n=1 Tax=Frankliniella occidentalis TaxID=133901 RepID=A0A6J1T575_FRAOC|nr:uncharacterized protein LOC113213560 [Frankliniella occidentalis]
MLDPVPYNVLNLKFWHKHGGHEKDQGEKEDWILIPLKPEPEKKGTSARPDAAKGRVPSQADSIKGRLTNSEARYRTITKTLPSPSKQVRSRIGNQPKSSPIPIKSTTTSRSIGIQACPSLSTVGIQTDSWF